MKTKTVYTNANIVSMNDNEEVFDSILITGGKIEKLFAHSFNGKTEDIAEDANVIDLHRATVLPGLYDAHCHAMQTGFFLSSANLLETKTIDDVLGRLSEKAKETPEGEWVFGAGFMSQNLKEQRFPSKEELDKVSERHPIMIAAQTLHGGSLNSKAISSVSVPDVAGVGKNADGTLNGTLLSDDSFFPVMGQIMGFLPNEKLKEMIRNAAIYAAEKGATSVVALMGQFCEGDRDVDIIESEKGNFPVNFTTFWQTWNLEAIKKWNLPRIGGCLTLDGAGFEYTMALNEPYPEHPERRGFLIHTDEEIYGLVSKAHECGIQTAFHALGDRAIDQLLYVFKQVIGEQGQRDLRHRIEHFSLPTKRHMELASELNLVCSMQPAFSGLWGEPVNGYYDLLLGRQRAAAMEVYPEILAEGNIVCGGSDSPVTLVDPLYGIACLINNPDPRRNLSVSEALKIFTINSAYSVHQENEKGSLEVGKDADMTIVDKNPYEIGVSSEIYAIKVLKTVKGGEVTYGG